MEDKKILLEFKAGLCEQRGKTVQPVPTKGLIQISKSDGRVHFLWKPRISEKVDSNHFEIPLKEAVFRSIGDPASRVFLLENKVNREKRIYWLQNSDLSSDSHLIKKINTILSENSPPALVPRLKMSSEEKEPSPRAPLPPAATLNSPVAVNHPRISSNLSRDSSNQANILQQILQNTLSKLGVADEGVTISQILRNIDEIFPILNDESVQEILIPLLPSSLQTRCELFETLNAPQFHQAIGAIEEIVKSDQLPVLLSSTGISLESYSGSIGTLSFLRAIQNDADKQKQQKQ